MARSAPSSIRSSLLRGPAKAAALCVCAALAVAGDARADARSGERLFFGETRFANRGPACGACHQVAGLTPPGGGTLGPDLTGAFQKYGPEALDTVLATLFFPTMDPLFAARPLTPGERADLQAFLAAAASRGPARDATLPLVLASGVLFAVLVAAIAWLGRTRLRGVRAGLVRRAQPSRRARP